MKRAALFAVLFACTALSSAFSFAAPRDEIVVSAASSLMNVFGEISKAFELENAGTGVVLNFGASGTLLRQMENGAPVDVFASADWVTMEEAAGKKLIDPSAVRVFARNELVLAAPAGSSWLPSSPPDLLNPSVKLIAVGDPAFVPAGRYAKEALQALGLWDRLAKKLIVCRNARQVLDYLSRGEVDAGVVFATDVLASDGKARTVAVFSTPGPLAYPLAVTKEGGRSPSAAGFRDFVLGEKGRVILKSYGFLSP